MDKKDSEIAISTKNGLALRFNSKEVPSYAKASVGVRALTLDKTDEAWFIVSGTPSSQIQVKDKLVKFDSIKKQKRDTKPSKV